MRSPLIVVSGTGTGIGKTHAAEALIRRWGRDRRVCGLKPIETGVADGGEGEDARRLREASTFHVKRSGAFTYREPISPHLAARRENRPIRLGDVVASVDAVRALADGVTVELPGGLFSPLGTSCTNADLARELAPNAILLVAPDRLGVLHEVTATCRAAHAAGLAIRGIALSTPEQGDASSGTNAAEISAVVPDAPPVLVVLRRASSEELAEELTAALQALLA